jgi:hypothetical protein
MAPRILQLNILLTRVVILTPPTLFPPSMEPPVPTEQEAE